MTKPFAFFNRDNGSLRFETLRELRNARIGEPREISLYTQEQVDTLLNEIKGLKELAGTDNVKRLPFD
jgi:hypothetical protein